MGPVGCAFLLSLLLGEPEVEVGGGRGFSAQEVAVETTRTLHTWDALQKILSLIHLLLLIFAFVSFALQDEWRIISLCGPIS